MNKKFKRQANSTLILIMALAMTGCAASYKRPESGPIAQVKVTTKSDSINMQVRAYEAPECTGSSDMIGRLNSKTIGDTFSNELTFPVKASAPLHLSIHAVVEMTGSISPGSLLTLPLGFVMFNSKVVACKPAVEFLPTEGATYELEHSASSSGCAIKVFRKMPGQTNRVEDLTAKPAKCDPRK